VSFSAIIPAATVDAANTTLEAAGWGPNNFATPLRPNGAGQGTGASHAALEHLGNDAAFQAAVAALPGCVVTTAGPRVKNFQAAVNSQALEWTDPTNWFLAPVMTGDQKISTDPAYPGLWESLVDFNVWAIPVGWREIVAEGYPAWVQPVGSVDAYPLGFRVTYNGQNWENTGSAANVWPPGVFGWVTIP